MVLLVWLSGLIIGGVAAWLAVAAHAAKQMRLKGAEWAEEKRGFEQQLAAHKIALLEAYKQDVRADAYMPPSKIWLCNRADFGRAMQLSYTFRHKAEPKGAA